MTKSELYMSVEKGRADKVESLVSAGLSRAEINWTDVTGWTALHQACYRGQYQMVAILLGNPHIDVNIRTPTENTALAYACLRGRHECVSLLLVDGRAKIDLPNSSHQTAFRIAVEEGHTTVVKAWIATGRPFSPGAGLTLRDCVFMAKEGGYTELASLIENYISSPEDTAEATRAEVGWTPRDAKGKTVMRTE